MTIDIEKLRALHAATTQGEWVVDPDEPVKDCYVAISARHPRLLNSWAHSALAEVVWKMEDDRSPEKEANATFIAEAHNILPTLLDEIEGLTAENKMLINQAERFAHMLTEARNNDRIAMAWLADCKRAARYEGDFPGLVKRIAQLRKVLGYFLELEDDFNEESFSYACRQASKFIDTGEQT